jgi:hypothetical protein
MGISCIATDASATLQIPLWLAGDRMQFDPGVEMFDACSITSSEYRNLETGLWARLGALRTNPSLLRSDSLTRTNDAINGVTLEQLRTGIF